MALVTPYMTEKFIAYISDVVTTNLTFAVWLTDEYTLQAPIGAVQAMLKGSGMKAQMNLSGYFLFTDLAAGAYTVCIEPEFYFPVEETVDTTLLDPKKPVFQIVLKPTPRYPFPANTTLLRGVLKNSVPIADAGVKVTGKTISTVTDDRGEFVLYFKGIKKEAIIVFIQKGSDTKSVGAIIEEGKTVSTGIIHFP
jgi:hypothetical protein